MTEEQRRRLERKLWDIADELRGRMDADEFRDYILGFIFYKYLSERLRIHADNILEPNGLRFIELDEESAVDRGVLEAVEDDCIGEPGNPGALGYFLKPNQLFASLARRGREPNTFIIDDLASILTGIQQSTTGTESEDDFDNLFEDLDLNSTKLGRTPQARNDLIAKVLWHLHEIDFELEDTNSDVLGDAYEYLIGKFASGAGKKAGEFYTPQQVSTIIARIVTGSKSQLRSVYDPACGSGSLLLRVAREVDRVGGFYGQEMNRTTYNLARMNMILHGVHYSRFDIRQEDTLLHPQHLDSDKFEAVVANPPFSAKWSAGAHLEADDRFSEYGRLAPKSKADFAFVQHMLFHLAEDGTMAVVLPHGVLFRGGAEGQIREFLVRRNWLDAVIGLPANIFYGTGIPTCLLVFRKCKEVEDVLFVDASGCFEKAKNQNMLRDADVDRIVEAYRSRTVVERFSHRASHAAIADNGFNLNIPRYVDTYVPEPAVDLAAVVAGLREVEAAEAEADRRIAAFCAELGIDAP